MRRYSWVLVLVAFVLVVAMLVGCTRYAGEKQLRALEETKQAALSAEAQVAQLEKENAELKAKLAEKQEELKNVQAEKEKVLSKLGQQQ